MRSNERTIIVAVAIVALAAAFYLLVLGPKRDKASELTSQIDQLNGSISAAEQQASYGEQARQEFPKYYGRMVVLGKAVPGEADTASLLVQLNGIADRSKMELRAIALNQGGATAATTAPAPTPAPAAPSTGSAPTAAASHGGIDREHREHGRFHHAHNRVLARSFAHCQPCARDGGDRRIAARWLGGRPSGTSHPAVHRHPEREPTSTSGTSSVESTDW